MPQDRLTGQGGNCVLERKYLRPIHVMASLDQLYCVHQPSCFILPPLRSLICAKTPHHWFKNSPKQVSVLPPAGSFFELASPLPFPPSSLHCSPHPLFLSEIITHVINSFSTGRASRRITVATCRSTRKHDYANTALWCLLLPLWGKLM